MSTLPPHTLLSDVCVHPHPHRTYIPSSLDISPSSPLNGKNGGERLAPAKKNKKHFIISPWPVWPSAQDLPSASTKIINDLTNKTRHFDAIVRCAHARFSLQHAFVWWKPTACSTPSTPCPRQTTPELPSQANQERSLGCLSGFRETSGVRADQHHASQQPIQVYIGGKHEPCGHGHESRDITIVRPEVFA